MKSWTKIDTSNEEQKHEPSWLDLIGAGLLGMVFALMFFWGI